MAVQVVPRATCAKLFRGQMSAAAPSKGKVGLLEQHLCRPEVDDIGIA